MKELQFTFWQNDEFFPGFLNDYPDYQTQAYPKEEPIENLKDLFVDLEPDKVHFIKKAKELVVA